MDPLTENYQLKWHSFNAHLHGCVANYLNSDSFADVVLFTTDGHQLLAHRFVLSSCSQYFHQVLKFQHKLTTSLPLVVVLPPEITYKTLKVLTQYMYTGETTVSKDILENVLRGGDLLKVQGLWRPREEQGHQDRKMVKVQQQKLIEEAQKNSRTTTTTTTSTTTTISKNCVDKTEKTPDTNKKNDEKANKMDNNNRQENQTEKKIVSEKENIKIHAVESCSSEERKKRRESENESIASSSNDNLQFLVIKEEPLEWSEVNESDMELIDGGDMFHTEMTIKPEVVLDDQDEEERTDETVYSPLTCELCAETFALPADWVKHIQSHTDMMPAKRQRRGRPSTDEDPGNFPPLHCDMCQKYFPTPAEWVHHIQNTHTEFELRLSNKTTSSVRTVRVNRPHVGPSHKICTLCDKKFPSHASMLIHRRTHTGEKPYMCEYCYKGFNVKSNLLRHLRTLHDRIINPTDVESKEESANGSESSINVDSNRT